MKAPSLSSISSVVLALGLVACGGDDGVTPGIDAPKAIDAPPVTCTVSTDNYGAKGALTANTYFVASMENPALYKIVFQTPLEAGAPSDIFAFEIYTGYEPFGTEAAPTPAIAGTYQIANNQLQYADCSICLTMATNVAADGSAYDDDYMATGGTVTITEVGDAVGENLNVTFANLTFEHVTFEGATSTPVGDGCETAITSASYTGQLMMPPANKPQAAGTAQRQVKNPALRFRR